MSKKDSELIFKRGIKGAGFRVEQPRIIVSPQAVKDRNGNKKKTKTLPDFYVVDEESGQGVHVEVTNGSGQNEHKQSQKRVAKAAKVENYVQLTGAEVEAIDKEKDLKKKRQLVKSLLNIITTIMMGL